MATHRKYATISNEVSDVLDAGINNRETFEAAVPLYIEHSGAHACLRRTMKIGAQQSNDLNTQITAYAADHKSVLENGEFVTDGDGVKRANVIIGDNTYRLAMGFDGYLRADGGLFTQDFLADLPENLIKVTTALNTSAVSAALKAISDVQEKLDFLAKLGLIQKPKNTWTLVEGACADL